MTQASTQDPIRYPFANAPEKGEWIAVAPGVYWLQMALPMALDHINLYVLEDDNGWYIVDTGMKWGDTQERWRLLFDNQMAGKPLLGVICTHMHPDHIGQAGWLCREFRVPLYMSFGEYVSSRMFSSMGEGDLEWTTAQYFQRSGIPSEAIEKMRAKFKGFGNIVEPMPKAYQRLKDGQVL
ncbi:MBL fold metallo-hydrolase, partial [Spongiibacter sp.]|uniref:MBL fold metallo-hydrolase n=1 Tax=Spongiibacter sp. TaxID=2024860 RepID=UPI000C684DA8